MQTGTDPDIAVLYEDNHLLALLKPPGLLSQQDRTGDPDLLTLARHYLKRKYNKPGNVWLGLLHRLDRPVSGVMLFARTSRAASRISRQIRERRFGKEYLAVCTGKTPPNGVLTDHLKKEARTNTVRIVPASVPGSKASELSYQRLSWSEEAQLSLLKIRLITGRAHQIRVQLAGAGHPLYGDGRYAKGTSEGSRPALFASALEFEHPVSGERVRIEASPPREMPWSLF